MSRIAFAFGLFALLFSVTPSPAQSATLTTTAISIGTAAQVTEFQSSAVDADGNLYAGGTTDATSVIVGDDTSSSTVTITGCPCGFVVKYNASRQVVWWNKYTNATSTKPQQWTLAVDGASPPNAYVTGTFSQATITAGSVTVTRSAGSADGYLLKLTGSTGAFAWGVNVGGTGASVSARSVAATATGDAVYFVGNMTSAGITSPGVVPRFGTGQNALIVKLDSSGAFVDGDSYGGGTSASNFESVAVDSSNNVYAVGTLTTSNLTSPTAITKKGTSDALLTKYNSSFSRQWTVNYGGTSATLTPQVVATDGSYVYFGGVYNYTGSNPIIFGDVTKTKINTGAQADGLIAKVSASTGAETWATNMGGATASFSEMRAFGVASTGTVFGAFTYSNGNLTTPALTKIGTTDLAIVKLNSAGSVIDSGTFGGAGASFNLWMTKHASPDVSFVAVGSIDQNLTNPAVTKIGNTGAVALTLGESKNLSITMSDLGTGTITSSPNAVSCVGTTCGYSFIPNTAVTLTATVDSNSTFSGWSGGCSGTSISISITMSTAASCTASFTKIASGGLINKAPSPPWLGSNGSGELNFGTLEATVDNDGRVNVNIPGGNFNDPSLIFKVSLIDGSALPRWLEFNQLTRSFSGFVPGAGISTDAPKMAADRPRSGPAASLIGRPLVTPPSVIASQITVMIVVTDSVGRTATTTFPITIYNRRVGSEVAAVSVTNANVAATGASSAPSLSDDGQAAVFQTTSTNLFPYDANPSGPDVIRYDVAAGSLSRFSTSTFMGSIASGARGWSGNASISADARYIAFASDAANIGLPWNYGSRQVWVTDASVARSNGVTPSPVAVSAAADGTLGDGASDHPSVSQDGVYVAFDSTSGNLVAGTTAGVNRVYRKNRSTGAIVLVSADAAGKALAGASGNPSISSDGRYVAFESSATGVVQIHRKDLLTGAVQVVSANVSGVAGSDASVSARISRDGRYVAFQTRASNLTGAVTTQVMRKDMSTGALMLISTSASGLGADTGASSPAMSGDGRFVAFVTAATNLGVTTNGIAQVLVRDTVAGTTALASTTTSGVAANGASSDPAMSGDGRYVAFASQATNLAGGVAASQMYMAGNPLQVPLSTGWWWNASEPGRGYAVEVVGDQMKIGVLLYNADGTPTWYTGTGPVSSTAWSAPLLALVNGPTLTSTYRQPTIVGSAASSTMSIASQSSAALSAPSTALQRYEFSSGGLAAGAQLGSPESGWWWTAAESGTGWFLEIQNSTLFIGGFYYDSRGQATWVTSAGTMSTTRTYTGALLSCANGQTLTGAYQASTCSGTSSEISIAFTSPISGILTLPGGRQVALERFRF